MAALTTRILRVVGPSPLYPNAIASRCRRRYGFPVPLGSLYTTLQRLHRRGLLKRHGPPHHRRYSRTPKGLAHTRAPSSR